MKKSARIWAVAFLVSLLPLGYLATVAFGVVVPLGEMFDYISLAVGFICTLPIWGAALVRVKRQKHRQDLLSLVAILVSNGYALATFEKTYFWQALAVTSVLLFGGWIQHRQQDKVFSSLKDLNDLVPNKASVIVGREIEHVDTGNLEVGDIILVRPGASIPADGYVIQGQSLVSEKHITGEVEQIEKLPGDWVLAGSENLPGKGSEAGPLTIRVSAVGTDLLIHELANSVDLENIQPAHYTNLAKVSSNVLTLVVVAAGFVAAGLALILGQGVGGEFATAVAVIVSAQVSLIAVSAPLAGAASSIRAAHLGVLVRSRREFEELAKINHVVFNKTGVLTQGYKRVGAIRLARNTSIGTEAELLALSAAVEMGTSHELGHLLIQEAVKRGLELPVVTDIAPIPGLGVSARFDGSLVQVGNAGMVNVSGINMNPYDLFQVSTAYQNGTSIVFVSVDELLVGYIEFPDELRANAQQTIVDLSGKHAITVLSGDATGVVEKVTTSLGLSDFAAEVLSTRKADWIKERRASGSKVLLIADGHYDAAALAEADVAYAFGAGHNVHLSSASLIQVSQDPLSISKLVQLSKRTQRRTLRNIIVGLSFSVLSIAAGFVGVDAPVIALLGVMLSWVLTSSIVRLVR